MTILEVNNLSKIYGNKQKYEALKNINFSVEKGEFVAIMGPSGSGKTTLLNVISSIDTISGGSVIIDGKEINKLNDKSSLISVKHNLVSSSKTTVFSRHSQSKRTLCFHCQCKN